jgi:UDP-sugar transporter A1/2/3
VQSGSDPFKQEYTLSYQHMLPANGSIIALVSLIVQNTALAILLKLTFRDEAKPYAASTAVLCTEFLKLSLCLLVVAYSSASHIPAIVLQIWEQKTLFLPALLYVVQSNLLFFSSKRLPPVVYIVCTQMKIITSAGFSRLLLGTTLKGSHYVSLVFLVLGIVLVQAQDIDFGTNNSIGDSTAGVFAVMLASLTSGLAGVVLEKLYKDPLVSKGLTHTVWTRNLQLSLISIPFALSGVCMQAPGQIYAGHFFDGYDHVVWSVIVLQTAGGIIIAFVLKFANVIMKCLAISVSICCCAVYSVCTQELQITTRLIFGILIVNASVVTFSIAQAKRKSSENSLNTLSSTAGSLKV